MEKQLFEIDYTQAAEGLTKMLKRRIKYYEESIAKIDMEDKSTEKALKSLKSVKADTDTILAYFEATEALKRYTEAELKESHTAIENEKAFREQEIETMKRETKLAVINYSIYQKLVNQLTVKLSMYEPIG